MTTDRFNAVEHTRFTDVKWVTQIGSTNTELLSLARKGCHEGNVLIADMQTAGRGRRGRVWTAPPGTSLMMSILLRPAPQTLQLANASLITSALAVSTIEAVQALTGVELRVKWPNDLVVDSPNETEEDTDPGYRKVAGILSETLVTNATIDALVIGMGLNVNWGYVPSELQQVATSLDLLANSNIDRNDLAYRILRNFELHYEELSGEEGQARTLRRLRKHSATLGRRVVILSEAKSGSERLYGLAIDVDDSGRLIVQDDEGTAHAISVADIEHLRLDGR